MEERERSNANTHMESARRRAYALRSRIGELGYDVSMSHTYEIMATASGHRNWPTMKARLTDKSDDGIAIAATTASGDLHGYPDPVDVPVRISRSKCSDHIEVIGSGRDFHADTILGILRGGVSAGWGVIFLNTTGDARHSERLMEIAGDHGRRTEFRRVDLNRLDADRALRFPKFDGRSSGLLDSAGSYDASWKFHQGIALDGALAGLVWLRDSGKIVLDKASAASNLGLVGMIEMHDIEKHLSPWMVRRHIRLAMESIPQGYVPEMGGRQTASAVSIHDRLMAGVVEMIGNEVEFPKGAYSFPGLCPLLLDAVTEGNIVAIDVPKIGARNDLGEELSRRVFGDVVRSMELASHGGASRPTVAAFTEADESVRAIENLDLMLRTATAAGGCLVLGSDRGLPFPGLKRATTIHEFGEIVSDDTRQDGILGEVAVREALAGRDAWAADPDRNAGAPSA